MQFTFMERQQNDSSMRSNLLLKEFGTLRPKFREIEPGVRVCRVPNFPYAIYYIIESSEIIIVAVRVYLSACRSGVSGPGDRIQKGLAFGAGA
jgi:hypothetical protein